MCKGLPLVLAIGLCCLIGRADEPGPTVFVSEKEQLRELVRHLEARVVQLEQRLSDVERARSENLLGGDLLRTRFYNTDDGPQPAKAQWFHLASWLPWIGDAPPQVKRPGSIGTRNKLPAMIWGVDAPLQRNFYHR